MMRKWILVSALVFMAWACLRPAMAVAAEIPKSVDEQAVAIIDKFIAAGDEAFTKERTEVLQKYDQMDDRRPLFVAALTKHMPRALGSDRMVVRVNAAMLINDLSKRDKAEGAMNMAILGLNDRRPGFAAVVYWSAKASEFLADAGKLNADNENSLLAALAGAAKAVEVPAGAGEKKSRGQPTLTAINRALAKLTIPEAAGELFSGIQRREKNSYLVDPYLSLAPEREGLRELYIRWSKATAAAGARNAVTNSDIKAMTRALCRLTYISLQYFDPKESPLSNKEDKIKLEELRPELIQLLDLCEQVFPWAVKELRGEAINPKDRPKLFKQSLSIGSWPELMLTLNDGWGRKLLQPALNENDNETLCPNVPGWGKSK